MPDVDELKEGKKYYTDIPQKTEGFFLKGSNSLDWGMKNRLAASSIPNRGARSCWPLITVIFRGRPPVLNGSI